MIRRQAREIALQVLYQLEMTKEDKDPGQVVKRWAEEFSLPEASMSFAEELVRGTLQNVEDIDKKISGISEGWQMGRMANVDRNVLRLSAYEILYRPDIPGRVTLNEAIELAKRFGGEDSAKFVNGILDKLVILSDKSSPKEAGKGTVPKIKGNARKQESRQESRIKGQESEFVRKESEFRSQNSE